MCACAVVRTAIPWFRPAAATHRWSVCRPILSWPSRILAPRPPALPASEIPFLFGVILGLLLLLVQPLESLAAECCRCVPPRCCRSVTQPQLHGSTGLCGCGCRDQQRAQDWLRANCLAVVASTFALKAPLMACSSLGSRLWGMNWILERPDPAGFAQSTCSKPEMARNRIASGVVMVPCVLLGSAF